MKYRKARTLSDVRRDPRVESVWSEGDDGWWASLKEGWVRYDGVISLHEYTIKELCRSLNDDVERR